MKLENKEQIKHIVEEKKGYIEINKIENRNNR